MENSEIPEQKDEAQKTNEQDENIQPTDKLLINSSAVDENENPEDDDWDEEELNIEENDPMDGYGTSGEKYGWYNGYSDDVIDDAFEGDPENTWNVD